MPLICRSATLSLLCWLIAALPSQAQLPSIRPWKEGNFVYMTVPNILEIDAAGKDFEDIFLETDAGELERRDSSYVFWGRMTRDPLTGLSHDKLGVEDSVTFRLYLVKGSSRILVDHKTCRIRPIPKNELKSGFAKSDTISLADIERWQGPYMYYEEGYPAHMRSSIHRFYWFVYDPLKQDTYEFVCQGTKLSPEALEMTRNLSPGARIWLTKVELISLDGRVRDNGLDFGWTLGGASQ